METKIFDRLALVFFGFLAFTSQLNNLKTAPMACILIAVYFALFAVIGWFNIVQIKKGIDRLVKWLFL